MSQWLDQAVELGDLHLLGAERTDLLHPGSHRVPSVRAVRLTGFRYAGFLISTSVSPTFDSGSAAGCGRGRRGRRHGGEPPAVAGGGPGAAQGGVLPGRDEGGVQACVCVPPGRGGGACAPPPSCVLGWACGASAPCGGPSSSCVVGGCVWWSCVRRLAAVVFPSWSAVPPLEFSSLCLRWFFGFCRPGIYEVIQDTYLFKSI